MSIQQPKALVRRFYEGDFIRGDASRLDEYFDGGFIDHDPPRPGWPAGVAGVRAVMGMLSAAFPNDRTLSVEDIFGEEDRVALRFSIDATHEGPFQGRPATGKKVTLRVVAILRVSGGRIVERWGRVEASGLDGASAPARVEP